MASREPIQVAVLLPVRDAESTLVSRLESLRAQTFKAFEVIAVDDGSRDRTPEILAGIEKAWAVGGGPHLRHLRLDPPAGIPAALKEAVRVGGDAPLLARHDADDESLPARFASQIAYLEAHPETDVVATGFRTLFESPPTDGWRRYEAWLDAVRTPGEIARNLWIESPLPHPTVMMRAEALAAEGGYRDPGWPEDYDLWLRMHRAGRRFAKIPEVLYLWRDHPGRASRTDPRYTPDAFIRCRAYHLAGHLAGRPVRIWGAGRDGRRLARALLREGVEVVGFLDIDPRKIGRRAYGRPILSADAWLPGGASPGDLSGGAEVGATERPADPMVLAAVGIAGAREIIRGRLDAAGFREGEDYLCLA